MKNCECKPIEPKCKKVGGLTIVVIPAQSGTSAEGEVYAPKIGDYKNAIVKYLADGLVYAYDNDGNWTLISDYKAVTPIIDTALDVNSDNPVTNRTIAIAIEELTEQLGEEARARQEADSTLQENIEAEAAIRASEDVLIRQDIATEVAKETKDIKKVQEELNRDFVNDLEMETSATNVTFKEDKVNPYTGTVSQEIDTIPAASSTTAGTISAAEYTSIKNSQDRLDALEGGSVAITGLPSSPTQEQLTTAWLNETGEEALINRASIYDSTNTKVWTYYSNDTTWHEVTAGSIQVSPFTNSIAGTILGSTTDGNVSANLDGTGTVSGWGTLKTDVASKAAASDLTNLSSTVSTLAENVAYISEGTAGEAPQITTGDIADGAVTSDKIDWTTILPRVIATTNTGSSGVITFTPQNLNHCWIIVCSKGSTDGTMGDIYFVRKGGAAIATVVSMTQNTANISVSNGTITITHAGGNSNITYAEVVIYEVM